MLAAVVAVARPVVELAGDRSCNGHVVGCTRHAAYVHLGGGIVAITPEGVAFMPAAVSVRGFDRLRLRRGEAAVLSAGSLRLGGTVLDWSDLEPWDPVLTPQVGRSSDEIGARGRELIEASGSSFDGAAGRLFAALGHRDAGAVASAADSLVGRGPGLTPEGDDVIAAVAATIRAFCSPTERDGLIAALRPRDLAARTNAISATLLDLALVGCVPEPVLHLLDLDSPAALRGMATARLLALGHGSGRTWVAGCGAAAVVLANERKAVQDLAVHAHP